MADLKQWFVLHGEDKTDSAFKSFNAKLKRAEKSFKSFGSNMSRTVTAPLVAVGGAFAFMGKKGLDSADRIGKLSKRLGTSTEFLSQMRFVASQSGIEFESLAKTVEFMQKGIGEASIGMGEAKVALEALNLSAKDLQDLSPEEQYTTIMKALEGVDDQAQRTALAMKLFGRSGSQVAQINGAFDELMMKADELGYTLSKEQTANAEKFNDAIDILKGSVANFATEIATNLAPQLQNIAEQITEGVQWFKDLNPTIQKTVVIIGGLAAAIGPLSIGIGALIAALPSLANGIRIVGTAISSMNLWVLGVTTAITALTAVWALWGDEITEFAKRSLVRVQNAWMDLKGVFFGGMVDLLWGWKDLTDGLWKFFYPVIELITTIYTKAIQLFMNGIGNVLSGIANMLSSLPDELVPDGWITGLENASNKVKEFGDKLNLTEAVNTAKKNLYDLTIKTIDYMEMQRLAAENAQRAIYTPPARDEVGSDGSQGGVVGPNATVPSGPKSTSVATPENWNVADWLMDPQGVADLERGIDKVQLKFEAFGDSVVDTMESAGAGFLNNLSNDIIEGENLINSLNDAVSNLGKNILNAGLKFGLSFIPGVGGLISGFLADGGRAVGGQAYVVGERGPELFIPQSTGKVIPNEQLQSASSSTTYTINAPISIQGMTLDDPRTRAQFQEEVERVFQDASRTYRG